MLLGTVNLLAKAAVRHIAALGGTPGQFQLVQKPLLDTLGVTDVSLNLHKAGVDVNLTAVLSTSRPERWNAVTSL